MFPYHATKEDDLLMKPYRIYNGKKIDIRWSGGWLTPEGEYYPVDYSNGITHETIAKEHGSKILGSGSIRTCPLVMRIYKFAGWIRITYFEGSTFCVELKCGQRINSDYVENQYLNKLIKFVNDYRTGFESYYINDVEYKKYCDFLAALKSGNITPTGGETGISDRVQLMMEKVIAEFPDKKWS